MHRAASGAVHAGSIADGDLGLIVEGKCTDIAAVIVGDIALRFRGHGHGAVDDGLAAVAGILGDNAEGVLQGEVIAAIELQPVGVNHDLIGRQVAVDRLLQRLCQRRAGNDLQGAVYKFSDGVLAAVVLLIFLDATKGDGIGRTVNRRTAAGSGRIFKRRALFAGGVALHGLLRVVGDTNCAVSRQNNAACRDGQCAVAIANVIFYAVIAVAGGDVFSISVYNLCI